MEGGYSAGSLEFDIGINKKTITKIYSTANALGKLASSLNKINNTQFVYAGDKLEVIFTKIARATNSINTNNIPNLASAAKSLSSISKLANLNKIDFAKVGAGFNTLSVAIQPFLDKVKEAEASLVSLDNILRRSSGKKIQGLLGGKEKSKGGLIVIAKLGATIYSMRRLGRFMANLVQAGSAYNETLNLWQVAMRNNPDVADQFVSKMQKAYGISSKTLMEAQAVFKNMIGSLGQISDATAYALSEALVQMSADYASLYNRTLDSAFKNMQSMLAGQVRPIRSAGLDMTETTLYQFYQQLGGTKSMRQLNRTEKQLLSILAVYQQMGSAGALGDMTKTLNQFANQSRMMTEYWAELKTWSGLLLKDLIDQSGMLVHINALLITTTEIVKAIAKARGIGDENFLTGMFETAELTNDEVDELQGKLLDFDKFRSLEGANASPLAIDEKLLQAITGYSSKIDQAQNEAQKLAKEWLSILGFTEGANGEFVTTEENLEKIESRFTSILGVVTALSAFLFTKKAFKNSWLSLIVATFAYGYATNEKFRESVNKLSKSIGTSLIPILDAVIEVLTPILSALTPIVESISDFIVLVDEAGYLEPIIWGIASAFTVIFAMKIGDKIADYTLSFEKFWKTLKTTKTQADTLNLAFSALAVGFLAISFHNFVNTEMSSSKRMVTMFLAVAGAITAAAVAMNIFKMNWAGALSAAALVSGAVFTVSTAIPNYEMGASDIDSGTVFRAGEFGKTEAVYTGSNGKTNVANIQQMKAAELQALKEWWATARHDIPAFQGVSDSGIYTIVDGEAKRRGKTFANK